MIKDLISGLPQCWGCPIFDRLFGIISAAGANLYGDVVLWALAVLVIFITFYILWAVYLNLKDPEGKDPFYQESFKPVLINSAIVCVLLGMGVVLPKFISSAMFEPVAAVTADYAEAVLQTDAARINQRVTYQPIPMEDNGLFRPNLRDKIIYLMKITITQFQVMIRLGLDAMDAAVSVRALFGLPRLVRHILMFFMGLYLAYQFFRLFLRFGFYFIDVVVALTMFAFFFPFMLVLFVFKDSKAADWIKKMGGAFSSGDTSLIKRVINTIVALVVAMITYTVVMVIIAKFLGSDLMSSNEIVQNMLAGTLSDNMLVDEDEDLVNMTLIGCILLGFLVGYIVGQIPSVVSEVLAAIGIKPDDKLGKEMADSAEVIAKSVVSWVGGKGKIIITGKPVEKKKPDAGKKEGDGDEAGEKAEEKKEE